MYRLFSIVSYISIPHAPGVIESIYLCQPHDYQFLHKIYIYFLIYLFFF